ncbi:MAG: NRDE family protein [Bacteroidetes bacterium]|nr:NRDE family protein [Bacteroidota bacterium]
MCTVTYLPRPNNGFILTHNRDEHFTRGIAQWPALLSFSNQMVLSPIDRNAGGTWITSSQNYTLCLLNGGFEKHVSQAPYRHSRGKIIVDFFNYVSVDDFLQSYNTHQLEPFTLIIVEHDSDHIKQCTFDGHQLHLKNLTKNQAYIWSSTTLYDEDSILRRKKQFEVFLQQENYTQEDIIAFHTNKHPSTDQEDILINRNDILKTVSLTSIEKSASISMTYFDFIQSKQLKLVL